MCAHPFAKEALTLHLARSEGHERYLGCNLMHHIALAGIVKLTLSERTYRVELTSFALIGRHRLPPARR